MTRKSKKQKRGVGTLILLLFASLILFVVTGYLSVCGYMGMNTGEMPEIFGKSLYVVQNDVDGVPEGSAIITDRTISTFEVGNPIVFYNPALETENKIMFQFVSSIDGENYITANASNENTITVSPNMIRGYAVSFTPFVGNVLSFAQTTTGTIIFIVVSIILLALFIYSFCSLCFGGKKRKQNKSAARYVSDDDDYEDYYGFGNDDEDDDDDDDVRKYDKDEHKAHSRHISPTRDSARTEEKEYEKQLEIEDSHSYTLTCSEDDAETLLSLIQKICTKLNADVQSEISIFGDEIILQGASSDIDKVLATLEKVMEKMGLN